MTLGEKLGILIRDVVPMIGLMVGIVIMMINGIHTPSEAAAFGALGVLILAAIYRCRSWETIRKSVRGAMRVTLMAYFIVFGSATFSQLLAFSGASRGLINWATGFDLDPTMMLLVMFGVLLVLGMFMEQISIMLLTVSIFFTLAQKLGFDPIWFGLIMLLALEISFTTPPFGLLLFVMKGLAPRRHHDARNLPRRQSIHLVLLDGRSPAHPVPVPRNMAAKSVIAKSWVVSQSTVTTTLSTQEYRLP
jgi:TRAP-type C4-dicarboxylate transport system permease large subunit